MGLSCGLRSEWAHFVIHHETDPHTNICITIHTRTHMQTYTDYHTHSYILIQTHNKFQLTLMVVFILTLNHIVIPLLIVSFGQTLTLTQINFLKNIITHIHIHSLLTLILILTHIFIFLLSFKLTNNTNITLVFI